MIKEITRLAILLISCCIYAWRRPYMDDIPLIILIVLFWLNVISAYRLFIKKQTMKFSMFIVIISTIIILLMFTVCLFLNFAITHSIYHLVLGIIIIGIIIIAGICAIYETMKKKKKSKSKIIKFPRR